MAAPPAPGGRSVIALIVCAATIFLVPALGRATNSRPDADACDALAISPPTLAIEARGQCAAGIVAGACLEGDGALVEAGIATRLQLPQVRLKKALRQFNSISESQKEWCDLTLEELRQVVAAASRSREALSEAREDWLRFTIGDENGVIPPDGLARALEQRRAIVAGESAAGSGRIMSHVAALPSTPAGWTNLTGYSHPVGRINALLIHPTSTDTMWAGADGGGIWKTTNGGTSWQPANDFLASLSVSSFAMRPGDPSIIYAATGAQGSHTQSGGAGIFKSVDGGTSWSQLPSTDPATAPDFFYTYQLAIHPSDSNTVLAATTGGAYITTNGGGIWTEIPQATARARNVAIHPANGNLRVIAMDDGTIRVATDGVTYLPYTIVSMTGSSYTRIALAPSNQNIMYALVNNGGTTQLYRSTTGGTAWTPVNPPAGFFYHSYYLSYTGGLWVDPTNANRIAVVEGWGMVTANASLPTPVWKQLCCGWVDFHGVVHHPGYNGTSNKKVFFFDDGGLYRWNDVDAVDLPRTSDNPAYLAPNGMTVTQAYSAAGRGGNLIFGAQDVASRYYRTHPPGDLTEKWRFATGLGGHDGAATAADRTNPNILYGSTQFLGIHRSLDGGQSTGFICQNITDISCGGYGGNAAFIAPFVLDPNQQSRMFAGAASLWRSNDVSSGTPPAWTAIHSGVGSSISAIAVAPTNSNIVWIAYQNGQVYKTGNALATTPAWTQVTTVPAGNKLRIYIDRTDASRVYLGLSGFLANRLVVTPNGGTNWSPVSGLPNASVFAVEQHPSVASWLYVGTAVGLFASDDGGTTWSATNEGPANVQVRDLDWYSESGSSAVLLVTTFGRGIWRATVNSAALTAPTGLVATGPETMVCAPPPGGSGDAIGPRSDFDWPPCTAAVSLIWNSVADATGYKVYRSSHLFDFEGPIGTPSDTSYTDQTALAGVAYLYMVRATNGATDSPNSNADLAATMIFSDPVLTGGVRVKSQHVVQLRAAVDAVRTLASLPAAPYSGGPVTSGAIVRSTHITELRGALNAARTALGLPAISYVDPAITPGSTPIRAAHILQLRQGVE